MRGLAAMIKQPELGMRLREIRMSKNLTQTEIALQSDISKQNLSATEKGVSKPREKTIKLICKALDLDYDKFRAEFEYRWDFKKLDRDYLQIHKNFNMHLLYRRNIVDLSRELLDVDKSVIYIKTKLETFLIEFTNNDWNILESWYLGKG